MPAERGAEYGWCLPGTSSLKTGGMGAWGGGGHVIGKGQFPPATGGCLETASDGLVLMASGSWPGAGEAEKPAPVASWTKRHVALAESSPWSYAPSGFPAPCCYKCALWPGPLGTSAAPNTGSEEDRWHRLGHHDVGLLISSNAGGR